MSSKRAKSHPAVQFKEVPIVKGPLDHFEKMRPEVLASVVEKTFEGYCNSSNGNYDLILGQALYQERFRLKRFHANVFSKTRKRNDERLWREVQAGLLRPSTEIARPQLLRKVLSHYSEEIGGHFDPAVYRVAVNLVPFGLSWMLNAASVKRFLPWDLTQSLESRMRIYGEVEHLKKLAQKGTILLVPTHQSNLDSILIGYLIYLMQLPPFAYGAGLNLFSNPVLNYFMGNLGAYTVDRQKSNEVYKNVLKNYSAEILKRGVHSIFFPGGGRARSGAIETKVKLGLLGTALDAQLDNHLAGAPKPNVYVVPMTISFHFVLEAASLIEDYLAEAGKHRYIIMDDESWQPTKVARFFWKFFSSQSAVTARIGRPLDVFGNFVDEEGRSLGPNGTVIDPKLWMTTCGQLRREPQRDREYTKELGKKIVERFHRENTILTSHLAAFAFFEILRRKYQDLDVYRFLRLSQAQRSMHYDEFLSKAEEYRRKLQELEEQRKLYLSEELKAVSTEEWVKDGVRQLGLLHDSPVIRIQDGVIFTEDMNLLYYYRNRLSGYGLSLLAEGQIGPGKDDSKGFLV